MQPTNFIPFNIRLPKLTYTRHGVVTIARAKFILWETMKWLNDNGVQE